MIIGFSGFATAGKTEAAKSLAGYTRVSFADALKDEVAAELGITRAELDLNKEKYRDLLVKRGAERRAEDPDYWIKRVVIGQGDTVIDDVRYANEARWIKSLGGKVVYVFRDGVRAANDEERRSIAGIWEQNLVDSVIQNNKDAQHLHKRANDIRKYHEFCSIEDTK